MNTLKAGPEPKLYSALRTISELYMIMKHPSPARSLLCAAAILMLASCSKDKDDNIRPRDAADLVAAAIEPQTGGLVDEIELLLAYFNSVGFVPCDNPTVVERSLSRTTGERTGTFNYVWTLDRPCPPGDTLIAWTGTFNGVYSTPRISGTTSGSRDFELSRVSVADSVIVLDGSLQRAGTQLYTMRNNAEVHSNLRLDFSSLTVLRASGHIISGTGTFQSNIRSERTDDERDFSGSLVVNGDGTASLSIEGEAFSLRLFRP